VTGRRARGIERRVARDFYVRAIRAGRASGDSLRGAAGRPRALHSNRGAMTTDTLSSHDRKLKKFLPVIFLLFFASGASGLIYEVVWTRSLIYVFGAAQLAVATVLGAFMGGLALGSLIGGRFADRARRPLRVYGVIEIGVAAAALIFPWLLRALDPVFGATYRALGADSAVFAFLRFLYVFALLMIPTTLMGATLPLLSRFLARSRETLGSRIGALYAINTTGAVVGTFCAGFLLLAALGVRQTVWLAAAMNLLVGAAAIWIAGRLGPQAPAAEEEPPAAAAPPESAAPEPVAAAGLLRLVLFSYFLSGAVALAYQVVWTRALVFSFEMMKNTTYAFSGMLTVFLIGLALGSALMTAAVDRQRDPLRLYALLQALIGLSGALSYFMIHFVAPGWQPFEEAGPEGRIFWVSAVANVMLKTAVSIGLPTLLMGMAFPVVARVAVSLRRGVGADVGRLYAVNTFGAIAGALGAGFLLIPAIGVTPTLTLLSAAQVAMGAAILWAHPGLARRARLLLAGGALLALVVIFLRIAAAGLTLPMHRMPFYERLIYYEEGPLSTVSIGEDVKSGDRMIYVDNVGVAGTDRILLTDQKSLAHVPALLVEAPRAALTVGFGSGGASFSYTTYKELERIHCVEIDPAVPKPAPLLTASNHGILAPVGILRLPEGRALDFRGVSSFGDREMKYEARRGFRTFDPRYRILLDDARSYLHFTDTQYDIIATDCTDLRYKSNANLYDLGYFRLCRERLAPGGMTVVWMPLGGLTPEAFLCALRTFHRVFPRITIWYLNNEPTHYILINGTTEPQRFDYARMTARLAANPPARRDLAELYLDDPAKLLSCFVTDETGVERLIGESGPLNTEDTPYLEFESPKYGYGDTPLRRNMELLYGVMTPLVERVDGADSATLARLDALQRAAPVIFEGHAHYRAYRFREAAAEWLRALEIAGGDPATRALLDMRELEATARFFRSLDAREHPREWISGLWLTFHHASSLALQRRWSDAVTALAPLAELAARMDAEPAPAEGEPDPNRELRRLLGRAEGLRAYCYAAANRPKDAQEILQRAMRLYPAYPPLLELRESLGSGAARPLPETLP